VRARSGSYGLLPKILTEVPYSEHAMRIIRKHD
jgi:hypothetical protein